MPGYIRRDYSPCVRCGGELVEDYGYKRRRPQHACLNCGWGMQDAADRDYYERRWRARGMPRG